MRRVRRDAARLALDVSHFKATRTWDDAQLKRAVAAAMSWEDVFTSLGIRTLTKETRARVEGHAIRLGLDVESLDSAAAEALEPSLLQLDPMRLRDAAAPLAAAWFMMRGCTVSLSDGAGRLRSHRSIEPRDPSGAGEDHDRPGGYWDGETWLLAVRYSAQNLGPRMPYDPKVIDQFFIVDGDLTMYLIPSRAVAGRVRIVADVQEVCRGERGRVAWCECGCGARDGGRVAVGVSGLRWWGSAVWWCWLPCAVSVFRSERECGAWLILGRGWGRSVRSSRCRCRRCCRSRCRTRCWR